MKKLLLCVLAISCFFTVVQADPTVRIGVLAKRGTERCLEKWAPTADYLNQAIPQTRFEIIPLNFEQILESAQNKDVEFLLSNPGIYVELSVRFKTVRLTTLNNLDPDGTPNPVFGGTAFCRKDTHPRPQWSDFKKSQIAAVASTSFGGWLTVLRELKANGLNAKQIQNHTEFMGTHDAVVYAVQDGRAEMGVVRTDTLERMALEGKIQLADFTIVPPSDNTTRSPDSVVHLHSTRLYPEWPFSKADHTDKKLAQQVAIALMEMPTNSPAALAARCAGWQVPMDYHLVEQCLQELNVRPFEEYGKVTLLEALLQHWPWALTLFILLAVLSLAIFITLNLNRQLTSARKVAEWASMAKSSFLANMSHEIRTPMNAVIGMTDLLMETELNAEQRESANIIRVSGEALLALINDVLDFSKIEAGHMDLKKQDFDLSLCIEDSLDLMVPKATQNDIELVYEIGESVPAVIRGDAGRLRQILLNLLSNAVKFTHEGEIALSVTERPIEKGHEIKFTVRDTGIGIEPDDLEKIFAEFTQADTSSTRQYGGTGLGLTISRKLSELMGGGMYAESVPGKGTSFYFTIHTPDTHQARTIHENQKAFEVTTHDVLIVDDNATNLKILSAQLTRWGLSPVPFDTPHAALESIQSGREYALMITDMQMPKMDGTMLVREVRKHRPATELPIIVLTSLGLQTPDEALDISAFLTKPAKPAQLYKNISNILSGDSGNYNEVITTVRSQAAAPPLKILLTEDNLVNQKVATRMLEKLGQHADIANDGIEALEMTGNKEYDLIFMDIQMPRLDGLETTRRLIKYYAGKKRPLIIGMTAHAANEEREHGLAAGMDDYLTKPIQLIKLKEVLWNVQETSK